MDDIQRLSIEKSKYITLPSGTYEITCHVSFNSWLSEAMQNGLQTLVMKNVERLAQQMIDEEAAPKSEVPVFLNPPKRADIADAVDLTFHKPGGKCDCGGEKTKSTHYSWCSSGKGNL
jgi:hypothetical protein